MEKAQDDLLQIIVEIKKTAQQKFLDTFEKTRVEFQNVFSRLFAGGETELALTDLENPLDAGVEVHVTIPGKRRQNLLLLSGGERAMTALALVLALIKVHPTPFVVLDEVDAPLDDANVGRYAELLREWSQTTQFILITHNRGTMEVASTLHGVTMQKAGISKLVSVRLEDWQPENASEIEAAATS
jgi:chromosome segregation protein